MLNLAIIDLSIQGQSGQSGIDLNPALQLQLQPQLQLQLPSGLNGPNGPIGGAPRGSQDEACQFVSYLLINAWLPCRFVL